MCFSSSLVHAHQPHALTLSGSALHSYNIPIIPPSAHTQKELNFKGALYYYESK